MSNDLLKTTIYDLSTGEVITRDLTPDEIEQYNKDQKDFADRKAEQEAKIKQRAVLLERLGITAQEAELLLS